MAISPIHIPNLFLIVGQPDNGKTTISNWFEQILTCEVIHTDQLYHSWIYNTYHEQYKAAKQNIRGHYPKMTEAWRREWNEYAVKQILAALKRAKLDLVVEGWLMLHLPTDLRKKLDKHATVMSIHMRRYVAHTGDKKINPQGRDYTRSVTTLCKLMAQSKGISFMRHLVGYQSFEDIRDFQGISDSLGKLLSLNLPKDMTGKSVLDVNCSTGYFTIRTHQRGAKAIGIDINKQNVTTATRIASTVYRTTDPTFYNDDIFTFNQSQQFDYILGINVLIAVGHQLQQFFGKAYDLLLPGGTLVIETAISKLHSDKPFLEPRYLGDTRQLIYPNEKMLLSVAKHFELTYKGRSVRTKGNRKRKVYHFTKPLAQTTHIFTGLGW